MHARQLVAGEAGSLAAGTDAGPEETFVGIDVADAVQQVLVEQGGLDGGLPAAEERLKLWQANLERFYPGFRRNGNARRLRWFAPAPLEENEGPFGRSGEHRRNAARGPN